MSKQNGTASPPVTPLEKERFGKVAAWMKENLDCDLPRAAASAGMSQFHFHRRFKRWSGKTFKQFMTDLQVEQAKTLMLQGVPLVEIATRCAFAHQSHFAQRFGQVTGCTPFVWRTQQKAAAEPRAVPA
jgi:AraC-like DNA-binding protein